MRRVEQVMEEIKDSIKNKDVLEVACGCAEFSLCASNIAHKVCCIDLDGSRMKFNPDNYQNLNFQIMDATKMKYEKASFDTVVIYNAIAHLEGVIDDILEESKRVTRKQGNIYVISSFKMDKWVIREKILPQVQKDNVTVHEDKQFIYVKIKA